MRTHRWQASAAIWRSRNNGGACWDEWENEIPDESILWAWQFTQYEFFRQWTDLKQYANERGISIIGDIPIYVAYDSSDVWANQELFCLDQKHRPSSVAGVPPDYFCEDG
ncbi:MAG: 4-alpha-glucanotransferase, partial [Ruminococcaceae bacterium]|nr:4-alpha-glucanotransferase [Oscillospiraceae bacterium]